MVWVPKQQNRARGSARQFWGRTGGGRGEIWLGRTRLVVVVVEEEEEQEEQEQEEEEKERRGIDGCCCC